MLLSSTLLILTLYIFGRIVIVNRRHKNMMVDILIVIGISLLSFIVFKYTSGTTKTIITCLLYASLFFCIFNIKLSKSIFTSIVYVILLVIPDLIVTLGVILIVGKEYFYEVLAGSLLSNVLVCTLIILLLMLLESG